MIPGPTEIVQAEWRLLDGVCLSICAPVSVILALGKTIELTVGSTPGQAYALRIEWNPDPFESLKRHFWKPDSTPESLMVFEDDQRHLLLGSGHYELHHRAEGLVEFYTIRSGEDNRLHFRYPFLRRIGHLMNLHGYSPIHTAAIGMEDRFALVPGKATAGKSTTTATWMLQRGDYLSDDFLFISGDEAYGFYRGVHLRRNALPLFQGLSNGILEGVGHTTVDEEKVLLDEGPDKGRHALKGRLSEIWCPVVGSSEPRLIPAAKSGAYANLLSSLHLNKEYGLDLRLCREVVKDLVERLPVYELHLTNDLGANHRFMRHAFGVD